MLLPMNYNEETKIDISLCFCIDARTLPWFYENYINLIIRKGRYLCAEFEDCFHPDFSLMKSIRINSFSSFSSTEKYIAFIKQRIDNGYYISTYFYVQHSSGDSASAIYEKLNYILIYGYDDSENKICFLMHDTVKGVIECTADICYFEDMFELLMERANELLDPVLEDAFLLEVTFNDIFRNRKFHVKTFLDNLNRYIFSLKKSDNDIVGLDVYDEYIRVLKDRSMPVVLRGIENISKHKEFLLRRFNYIKDLYYVFEEYERLLSEYNIKVVLPSERIKLLSVKHNMRSTENFIFISDDSTFRTDICDRLRVIREDERSILTSIYAEIKTINKKKNNTPVYSEFSFSKTDANSASVDLKEPMYLTGIDLIDTRKNLSYAEPAKIIFDNGDIHYIYDSSASGIRLRDVRFNPISVKSFCIYQNNLSYMGKNSVQLHVLPAEYVWEKGLLREWKAIQQFSEINYGNDIECSVYNNNPYFIMNEEYINADVLKYIYIKYSTLSESEAAQIWFVDETSENGYFNVSKTFAINPGKELLEYKIDMSSNAKWKGLIEKIRFDPVHYDHYGTSVVKINSIRICDEMPIYNNDDFCCTQGINGWFYYSYDGDITYKELNWKEAENVWNGNKIAELKVGKYFQTSAKQFASVRRWFCPASGTYRVKVCITPISSCYTASFAMKKNFSIPVFSIDRLIEGNEYIEEKEIVIDRGEYISFEFLNKDELSVANINISCSISKTAADIMCNEDQ